MLGGRDVEEELVDAALAGRARALGRGRARRTRVDERGTVSALIDLLKVDHELAGIVFGVRKHLGTKECNDVV